MLMIRGPQQETAAVESASALGAGPVLLNFSVMRPRRSAPVRRGCKTDLTCFYPPLPLCQSRRGLSQFSTPAALSEAGSAEREEQSIRRPPRKPHPHPQLRGSTSLFPQTQAHPVGDYQFTGTPTRSTPVLPKPDRQGRIWARRFFSLDRERPVSLFGAPKREMGGSFPRPLLRGQTQQGADDSCHPTHSRPRP